MLSETVIEWTKKTSSGISGTVAPSLRRKVAMFARSEPQALLDLAPRNR